MARGSLTGFITGTVVSGVVAGVASVMTDMPGTGAPEATALEVPAGSEFDQARDDTQAELPKPQETPDANDVVKIEPPAPDDLSTIDTDATASTSQPETGDTELALNTPDAGDSAVGVQVDSDSPVLPSPQANAPEAPASEEELSISTEPAQPTLPDPSDEETAFVTPSEADTGGGAPEAVEEEAQDSPRATDVATSDPVETETATATQDDTASQEAEAVEAVEAAEAQTKASDDAQTTVSVQDDVVEPRLPVVEAPDTAPEAEVTPVTPIEPQDDQVALVPETGVSTSTIDDIAPNVTTDRLPSVAAEPEAPVEAETAEGEDQAKPAADDGVQPPIERYAVAFENPEGKPLMSIVLIDRGDSPIGLEALKSFPYPLSFAVDTSWPGAGAAMQNYRDAGFEVLAMIDLPEGQAATDTEVSMQTYLERVPQAVAVMEGDVSGLQAGREASEQLAQILRDSGHGAVLFPNGLNTAQKLIAREGVPSASVFRDFDAKGQNATVIRRFLDQAAFRADQEEKGVIMVGRQRADTISALLLWGLQDRASRVAIAPVSAVLTAQ